MVTFLVARHGESATNSLGVVSGPEMDPELTAKGVMQSEELAHKLKNAGIRRIISSDYRRALQTAEIVNSSLRVELLAVPEYRERDFGMYIGKPLPEDWRFLYEAKEGLETYDQLAARFSRMPAIRDGDLLVGHGVSTPLFLDYIAGRPMGNCFVRFRNCQYEIIVM